MKQESKLGPCKEYTCLWRSQCKWFPVGNCFRNRDSGQSPGEVTAEVDRNESSRSL